MTTVAQALASARAAGHSRLDADLLLLLAIGIAAPELTPRRGWLLAHDTDLVEPQAMLRFQGLVERRNQGEPMAYITGHKEFFGLDLVVDSRVLVPRPDTELLVQWALDVIGPPVAGQAVPRRLLDLGTGSGAVALAIKHSRPELQVDAVDASTGALEVARCNADRLGLELHLMLGNWLDPVVAGYHCIVSNPPYVQMDDPHLPALRHEPLQALVSGSDGLFDLRGIVGAALGHLVPGGWLLLEHGYDQGPSVQHLLQQAGFVEIGARTDLAGHWRCSAGQRPQGQDLCDARLLVTAAAGK